MPVITIWQVIKELAISLKYYMEVRAKNIDLNNIYASHDREEAIYKEIIEIHHKKDQSRREGDSDRVHFFEKAKNALERKSHVQQKISLSLENKLHSRE